MKVLRFLLALIGSLGVLYAFNAFKFGPMPPLGKFFNPQTGFWQNTGSSELHGNDRKLIGLQDEVQVLVDSHAIAHILANNNHDLYFMQGYVTARDRLWQMDFTARVASGRLSEVIGRSTLDVDRFFRRMGLARAASESVEVFKGDPLSWEAVNAYTNGVNAWINSLEYQDYPIEYKLMDYKPELWAPIKCALIGKMMAFNLAAGDDDLQMSTVLEEYGRQTVETLFPDFPLGIDPIFTQDWSWIQDSLAVDGAEGFNESTSAEEEGMSEPAGDTGYEFGILPAAWSSGMDLASLTRPSPRNGSNNWALSGRKTATGKPLLANDTHLSLWMPCSWYMIQLTSPDCNVMGATLPGAPSVIIGFNDSIAWGLTNSQRDVKDWYKNAEVTHYVVDTIKVRGGRTFYDTISYTDHGPIMYDASYPHSLMDTLKQGFAMKWAAHEPSNELETTLELNRAKNFDDYLESIASFKCPGQNFVFASVSGDIALKQQGQFPNLKPQQGRFILDASEPGSDWQGWIPMEFNPMEVNPARGYVSSANQHPTGLPDTFKLAIDWYDVSTQRRSKIPLEIATAPYPFYYQGNFEFYRNRRIKSILDSTLNATVEDMRALQNDKYSLLAAELLPFIKASLQGANLTGRLGISAQHAFEAWDCTFSADSYDAAAFYRLFEQLYELTFDEFTPKRLYPKVEEFVFVNLINSKPDHPFFDIITSPERETASDLVVQAYSQLNTTIESSDESTASRWGDYREVRLQHATRSVPAFDVSLNIGGEEHTVNALDTDHGPAWKMIVSLEDDIRAWAIYPGGQSGNPGSAHYDDFVQRWADGELLSLIFVTSDTDTEQLTLQQFAP